LEKECEHLRRSGFRAWLLNGGLNYWREKGAPLHGDGFAQKGLNRVPPRAFFAERDYENWIVIDISAPKRSHSHPLTPQSISIPYLNDEERFILTLEKALAKEKDNQFLSVLIFSQKGEYYHKIEKLTRQTGLKNVFFLKGGIEAYQRFLGQQALISQARHNRRKALKKCADCP
jgi:rhodanese-related sulfurtransferase